MKITVELLPHEAKALLTFLSTVPPLPSILDLENKNVALAFESASEKMRIALRDNIEPGWRDKFLKK